MTRRAYDELAASLLKNTGVEPTAPSAESRSRTLLAMEHAYREQRRLRQRRRRMATVSAGVALAAGFAMALLWHPSSSRTSPHVVAAVVEHTTAGARVVRAFDEQPLLSGMSLMAGSRIRTPDSGRVTVALPSASAITLHETSELELLELEGNQHLVLSRGMVDARVKKLGAGQRFRISTPDAEVEVRGTAFRVAIREPDTRCRPGPDTEVEVDEGLVLVRYQQREIALPAGSRWPPPCFEPTPSEPPLPQASVSERTPERPRVKKRAPGSSLGHQNDLLSAAVDARRRGELEVAIASLDELLSRYPRTALAEAAKVERMRSLKGLDISRARQAARAYLSQHPRGFARDEALKILERQR